MSGRITSAPKAKHYCNAGWHVETDEEVTRREQAAAEAEADDSWFPGLPDGMRAMIEDRPWPEPGTIWTCDDCGLPWKATYPYDNMLAPTWVRHRPIKPIRWPWKRRES